MPESRTERGHRTAISALSWERDLFSALCFKDYLLFKPVTALSWSPSLCPGWSRVEPSPSRWLVKCSRRTSRKGGPPSFAAACVFLGAASGTERPLGHYLVRSLPCWVPPKVSQKAQDSATTDMLFCCTGVKLISLPMGWRRC